MQIREFVSPSLLVSFQNTALLTVQVLHTYLYGKNRRHKSTCGHADSTEFFFVAVVEEKDCFRRRRDVCSDFYDFVKFFITF